MEEGSQVSPQKENGHFGIANEIWDALNMVRLTANEYRALRLIFRLSYGCRQRVCQVENWKDFHTCGGVHYTAVTSVLRHLEEMRILAIEWDKHVILFNKHYDTWQIDTYPDYDPKRYAQLIDLNLKNRTKNEAYNELLSELARSYEPNGDSQVATCYEALSRILESNKLKYRGSVPVQMPDMGEESESPVNHKEPGLPVNRDGVGKATYPHDHIWQWVDQYVTPYWDIFGYGEEVYTEMARELIALDRPDLVREALLAGKDTDMKPFEHSTFRWVLDEVQKRMGDG